MTDIDRRPSLPYGEQVPKVKQRGPYRTGIQSRAKIVAAAVDVFGRYGYKGGTLQQVADTVGLTAGAITKLFGSKEQLLIAVLQHWAFLTEDVIGAEAKGKDRLEGFGRLMAFHMEHRGFLELYITMAAETAAFPEHPAHDFMVDRYISTLAHLRSLLAEGVKEGSFNTMSKDEIDNEAECLLAAMDGLEIQFLLNPGFDLERSFRMYVQNLEARRASADAVGGS
ncbi:TetR/AcrR family transcriptional regulator [Amnibacterium sp.]|uniref:TetR/AcrR family transcriptional regulator n=1 Tax=Amnibacterium sp. TaxID=1872496 RepID=UPI002631B8FF|nr:TetR/AcrR family transcriptional regulator [Amnibacterium sp.]MCU1472435.1 transcriptional regulator, TetR family [Amnibacterium sp.]